MAILRFKKEPTPVVFREGISGKETQSTVNGEREWQHFVNQYRDSKDTIYLSEEAQSQLERLNPRPSETVLISIATINREKRWFVKIAEPSDAAEPARHHETGQLIYQRSATKPSQKPTWEPATSWGHSADQERRDEDGGRLTTQTQLPPQYQTAPAKQERQIAAEPGGPHQMNYPPSATGQDRQLMAGALVAGIEAAQIAEKATGVTFTTGDLRSIGISLYIEACKLRAAMEERNRPTYAETMAAPIEQRRTA